MLRPQWHGQTCYLNESTKRTKINMFELIPTRSLPQVKGENSIRSSALCIPQSLECVNFLTSFFVVKNFTQKQWEAVFRLEGGAIFTNTCVCLRTLTAKSAPDCWDRYPAPAGYGCAEAS